MAKLRRLASSLDAAHALDPVLWVQDRIGVVPDHWQEAFLRSLKPETYLLCHRQAGKTECCAWRIAHSLTFFADTTTVAVGPAQRQAAELTRRVAKVLDAAGVRLEVRNAFGVETRHGSRLIAVPGGEDASGARGFTANTVVVDEGCFVAEAVISALRPMLATTKGHFLCLSSAGPASSWFAQRWTETEQDPEVARFSIVAEDNPRIDTVFLARERKALGELRYAQEYCNAFATPGARWFAPGTLASMFGEPMTPEIEEQPGPPTMPAMDRRAMHTLFEGMDA